MEYRELGQTGLEVSTVSMGALQLGGVSQNEVNKMIEYAREAGINYIDTARVYGASEKKLGVALKGKREDFILSSKAINRNLKDFRDDVEISLNNLDTDYIDIYFLHDVSTEREWEQIQKEEILTYLEIEKQKGRIRHIGFSTHSVEIGRKMLEEDIFEVVMLAYNANNSRFEVNLIPVASRKNLGIIIMKPYAGGILTESGSEELGFNISAEESLNYVASHPDISTVIPGLDRLEYMKTAVRVARNIKKLSDHERKEIEEKVEINSENYCRGCGYCLPCQEGIDIPKILKLYNRWEAFNTVNWAQMHMIGEEYDKLEIKARACIGCDQCQERCPYDLPVSEMMGKVVEEMG